MILNEYLKGRWHAYNVNTFDDKFPQILYENKTHYYRSHVLVVSDIYLYTCISDTELS